jgi:Nif-specific regulatory protein
VYEQVAQVAATNTTVLVAGVGHRQELIAHAFTTTRSGQEAVREGQLRRASESLIEAGLFGHERAFTGAEQRKKGRFELAEGARCFSTRSATSTCPRR